MCMVYLIGSDRANSGGLGSPPAPLLGRTADTARGVSPDQGHTERECAMDLKSQSTTQQILEAIHDSGVSGILVTVIVGLLSIVLTVYVQKRPHSASRTIPITGGGGRDIQRTDELPGFESSNTYTISRGKIILPGFFSRRTRISLEMSACNKQKIQRPLTLDGSGYLQGNIAHIYYTGRLGKVLWPGSLVLIMPLEGDLTAFLVGQNTTDVAQLVIGKLTLKR